MLEGAFDVIVTATRADAAEPAELAFQRILRVDPFAAQELVRHLPRVVRAALDYEQAESLVASLTVSGIDAELAPHRHLREVEAVTLAPAVVASAPANTQLIAAPSTPSLPAAAPDTPLVVASAPTMVVIAPTPAPKVSPVAVLATSPPAVAAPAVLTTAAPAALMTAAQAALVEAPAAAAGLAKPIEKSPGREAKVSVLSAIAAKLSAGEIAPVDAFRAPLALDETALRQRPALNTIQRAEVDLGSVVAPKDRSQLYAERIALVAHDAQDVLEVSAEELDGGAVLVMPVQEPASRDTGPRAGAPVQVDLRASALPGHVPAPRVRSGKKLRLVKPKLRPFMIFGGGAPEALPPRLVWELAALWLSVALLLWYYGVY